jgi:hypothetical protein
VQCSSCYVTLEHATAMPLSAIVCYVMLGFIQSTLQLFQSI